MRFGVCFAASLFLFLTACSLDAPQEGQMTKASSQPPPAPQPQPETSVVTTIAVDSSPVSLTVKTGESIVLSVSASSNKPETALLFKWYKNGAAIPNAVSNTLSIAAAALGDAGEYYAEVSAAGVLPVQSLKATVTVKRVVVDGVYRCSPQIAYADQVTNYECSTGVKVEGGKFYYAHVGGRNNLTFAGVTWIPFTQAAMSTIQYMGATCKATFDPEYGIHSETNLTYLAQYEPYKKLDCPFNFK